MVQLNPVPVFGAKKIPVPFDGIFTEISVQMLSAHSINSVSDSNLFTTYVLFIVRHGYYALLGILGYKKGHRRLEKSLDTGNVTRNAKQRRTNKS